MEKDEDGVVTISLPKKAKKETEVIASEEDSVEIGDSCRREKRGPGSH